MEQYDLVVVGGGPAGLAAAVAARENGVESILILERESRLGGILNQCIHNGFGLHTFHEELTGTEYAYRYIERVKELGISYKVSAVVTDITPQKRITAAVRGEGLLEIEARAVILAMGCRERSRGALNIAGTRPAGIYSAGTAQYFVNVQGFLPGKEVVILGSGDIGLIMARRMTLEGAKVRCVVEIQPKSGGLQRNIVQCLEDYGIPLILNHTVVEIHGDKRLTGVTIAAVDERKKPVAGTEEVIACDTLLLSVGLIPENELTRKLPVTMLKETGGPQVDEKMQTQLPGVFACGNTCPRGEEYARKEITAPTRMVTGTVKLTGSDMSVMPVRLSREIPKEKIFAVMGEIQKCHIQAPVRIGDVLIGNVCGLGVDVVAAAEAL